MKELLELYLNDPLYPHTTAGEEQAILLDCPSLPHSTTFHSLTVKDLIEIIVVYQEAILEMQACLGESEDPLQEITEKLDYLTK